MKVQIIDISNAFGPDYSFYCPGCKCDHGVWIIPRAGTPCWEFNGNIDKPTFSPSILVRWPEGEKMNICHSFVKDGFIQYLNDCTHELAGQTVEMEDIDAEMLPPSA
jgi:hypothetical protein